MSKQEKPLFAACTYYSEDTNVEAVCVSRRHAELIVAEMERIHQANYPTLACRYGVKELTTSEETHEWLKSLVWSVSSDCYDILLRRKSLVP